MNVNKGVLRLVEYGAGVVAKSLMLRVCVLGVHTFLMFTELPQSVLLG